MRVVATALAAFLLSAAPALAEPYYMVHTNNDATAVFLVDAGSIKTDDNKTYRFVLMNVYNAGGIQDGVKYKNSTLKVDCEADEFSIVDLQTFDASHKQITSVTGSDTRTKIGPNTVVHTIATFVCDGTKAQEDPKNIRLPTGQHPTVAVDRAYTEVFVNKAQ